MLTKHSQTKSLTMSKPTVAISYKTSSISASPASLVDPEWSEELPANKDYDIDNSSTQSQSPSSAISCRRAARKAARRAAKVRQGHRQHQRLIRRNSSRRALPGVDDENAEWLEKIEDLPGSKFTCLTSNTSETDGQRQQSMNRTITD